MPSGKVMLATTLDVTWYYLFISATEKQKSKNIFKKILKLELIMSGLLCGPSYTPKLL